MTKLRKIKKNGCTIPESLPKCCRWCHYFSEGKCYNKNMIEGSDEVYLVAEEGHLSETIEEVLGSVKLTSFNELEHILRTWGVSNKRIKEFNTIFKKCYEKFSEDLKEVLDEQVSLCYQSRLDRKVEGVIICNPEEFVCKDWC